MKAHLPSKGSPRARVWPFFAVALLVAALVASKWDRRTGFTSLLRFGDPWHARRLDVLQPLSIAKAEDSSGYDGQFYAQLAVDPWLRAPELKQALDNPSYRARRILLPWIAAVLGCGQPWWTLQIFALLNLVAWAAVAWLLYREIGDTSAHGFARWSACVLSLGAMESVRLSLVDLPALALVLWAISAQRSGRPGGAMLIWPLAVLTKETALLSALAEQVGWVREKGGLRRVAIRLSMAVIPLILWWAYVKMRLGYGSEDALQGNFGLPGAALASEVATWIAQLVAGNWSDRAVFALLAVVGFSIQAAVVVRQRQPASVWWRIGVAHVGLLLVLGDWVWSGYWAAARAMLPLTVAFNLLLPAGRGFWPLWAIGNLSLVHGLIRFL